MEDDPFKPKVDKIAEALGLECVGHIFTSYPLDLPDQLLTPQEILRIARLQEQHSSDAHFTKYRLSKFVSCAVRPDASQGGNPAVSSFMVTDQCVALLRDGMFSQECEKEHLLVREAEKGEFMPNFLMQSMDTRKILADFFIVRVVDAQPKKSFSLFTHSEFPRENRGGARPANNDDLKQYFKKRSKQEPSWSRFADFHALLYIAKAFDVDTCLNICECVRERKDVESGMLILFESLMA